MAATLQLVVVIVTAIAALLRNADFLMGTLVKLLELLRRFLPGGG